MSNELPESNENTKALPPARKPSLETNPGDTPVVFADASAPDVQFVLATFSQCVAQASAKGGDERYLVQSAMVHARRALGVAVALGIMESHTTLENGEPLWLSPAVPPMGVASTKNATLQG